MLQRLDNPTAQPVLYRRLTGNRRSARIARRPTRLSSLLVAFAVSSSMVGASATASLAQSLQPNTKPLDAAETRQSSSLIAQADRQPPEALTSLIAQADRAASQRNLSALLRSYDNRFRNSDGLNRRSLAQSIKSFWDQYSDLSYETTILTWERTNRGFTTETETLIKGSRQEDSRRLVLDSTIRSRQVFENGLLVRQEILSERSKVTTGDRPPTLQVNLPDQVSPGQSFNFDVIVLEPIENDLLFGGLVDEPVSAKGYGSISQASLEPLVDSQTGTGPGGLFKVGTAPRQSNDRWISAVVMRKGGITMVTQRLRVSDR